jgi:hypothetical protein
MCDAVTCTDCGKTTWSGCGRHINAVKRTVPANQWCNGHRDGVLSSSPTSPFRMKGKNQ